MGTHLDETKNRTCPIPEIVCKEIWIKSINDPRLMPYVVGKLTNNAAEMLWKVSAVDCTRRTMGSDPTAATK